MQFHSFLKICGNIRINFLLWAYMYTTLKCLGKRVIQTNPSKLDERREAWKEEALDDHSWLQRTREGHRQSDEHWNRFKGDAGETSERRGGAHMGFSERRDTILN